MYLGLERRGHTRHTGFWDIAPGRPSGQPIKSCRDTADCRTGSALSLGRIATPRRPAWVHRGPSSRCRYPQRVRPSLSRSLPHELSSLFLFSFLLSLSTLFLCIFSANFAYRSFSSLAARFSLINVIRLCLAQKPHVSIRLGEAGRFYCFLMVARTFLSSSFSSFISFSLAFMAASATLSFARFSYEVSPEPGRKAFLGACHCLPAPCRHVRVQSLYRRPLGLSQVGASSRVT